MNRHASPRTDAELALLRERAAALALVPNEAEGGAALDLVIFCWGTARYALEASYVAEAFLLKHCTPLPGTPRWLRGVVNVRSQVLAVVDVAQWLGLAPRELAPGARLLIVQGTDLRFAFPVDALAGAGSLDSAQVQSGAMKDIAGEVPWLRGVTPDGLTLMCGAALLADARLNAAGRQTE